MHTGGGGDVEVALDDTAICQLEARGAVVFAHKDLLQPRIVVQLAALGLEGLHQRRAQPLWWRACARLGCGFRVCRKVAMPVHDTGGRRQISSARKHTAANWDFRRPRLVHHRESGPVQAHARECCRHTDLTALRCLCVGSASALRLRSNSAHNLTQLMRPIQPINESPAPKLAAFQDRDMNDNSHKTNDEAACQE